MRCGLILRVSVLKLVLRLFIRGRRSERCHLLDQGIRNDAIRNTQAPKPGDKVLCRGSGSRELVKLRTANQTKLFCLLPNSGFGYIKIPRYRTDRASVFLIGAGN